MNINYLIVDASEYIKESYIQKVNKLIEKWKNTDTDEDNGYSAEDREYNIGLPISIQGKMLKSDIDDLYNKCYISESILKNDTILWGYVTTCTLNTDYGIIYLIIPDEYYSLVTDSLEYSNIAYYSTGEDVLFGDIKIVLSENEGMEDEVKKWVQDFSSLIENSKEYKNLLKRFTEWQL